MRLEDYRALTEHGIIGTIEFLQFPGSDEPVVTCGNFQLAFSADQVAAAAVIGIDLAPHQPAPSAAKIDGLGKLLQEDERTMGPVPPDVAAEVAAELDDALDEDAADQDVHKRRE